MHTTESLEGGNACFFDADPEGDVIAVVPPFVRQRRYFSEKSLSFHSRSAIEGDGSRYSESGTGKG